MLWDVQSCKFVASFNSTPHGLLARWCIEELAFAPDGAALFILYGRCEVAFFSPSFAAAHKKRLLMLVFCVVCAASLLPRSSAGSSNGIRAVDIRSGTDLWHAGAAEQVLSETTGALEALRDTLGIAPGTTRLAAAAAVSAAPSPVVPGSGGGAPAGREGRDEWRVIPAVCNVDRTVRFFSARTGANRSEQRCAHKKMSHSHAGSPPLLSPHTRLHSSRTVYTMRLLTGDRFLPAPGECEGPVLQLSVLDQSREVTMSDRKTAATGVALSPARDAAGRLLAAVVGSRPISSSRQVRACIRPFLSPPPLMRAEAEK